MRPDDVLLSAYLDGEVPRQFLPAITASIKNDPVCQARLEKLQRLRVVLHSEETPEVELRMTRSLEAIHRRVSARPGVGLGMRWRRTGVPLPAFAAAAFMVVALSVVLIWSLLPSPPTSAPDYLAQGQDVDVTIRVDDADMEHVLQWLADKEMLGEISIQLPEQQFQIVGEPVLLKPGDASARSDIQVVPDIHMPEDNAE